MNQSPQQSLLEIDDIGPYQIHSSLEIVALMRRLSSSQEPVRLIFNQGEEALVTTVLMANEFVLTVSAAYDTHLTERIIACDNVSFDTALDRVRIVFFAKKLTACLHLDKPALRFLLPASVIRLQRREFYRVMTSRCAMQIHGGDVAQGKDACEINFTIENVSAGGVAILDDRGLLDDTIGHQYRGCKLTLQGASKITATLRVMNSTAIDLPGNRRGKRIGLSFVNLTPSELVIIQRSISQAERERNSHLG